jgi:uncharacterized protein (TIGR02266 family)
VRILYADDDKFFQKVTANILNGAGHEVLLASTGQEAIEKAMGSKPDLIILDVILPGLLGTEVCRKLRNYTRTASVPVLLISTGIAEIEAASGDPKEFLADDFMHKPFKPEKLLERVERLLGTRSAFAASGQGRPPTPPPGRERRQTPRVPIDVEVTARTAEALLYHPMINISTGGVYLEVDRPTSQEAIIELRFVIPGVPGLIAAEGKVAWTLELEPGARWAMGVKFTSIEAEALDSIRRYVNVLMLVVRPEGITDINLGEPAGGSGGAHGR